MIPHPSRRTLVAGGGSETVTGSETVDSSVSKEVIDTEGTEGSGPATAS